MKKFANLILLSFVICSSLIAGIFLQKYNVPSKILFKGKSFIVSSDIENNIYAKPVDPKLLEVFGTPDKVYGTDDQYIYNTGEEKGRYDTSYRYYWHYEEIANYLVSEEAKLSARETHENFWGLDENDIDHFLSEMKIKREFFKETIGIQNLNPNGKSRNSIVILRDDTVEIKKLVLESRIDAISVPLYATLPTKRIRGVVIAIHGHSGAPEKVIGLEDRDYTREFGKKLAEEGYAVFAPYVMNISRLNTNIHALGMLYTKNTKYSIDIQKILSIVDYIKENPSVADLPLVVYGISYGGRLALILGAIDERINIVVTSGGMKLNREFLEQHYGLDNNVYWASEVIFNNPFHIYFAYSDLAKMIFPRPLIIELGAHDLGEHPDSIINDWKKIHRIYNIYGEEKKLKLAWFNGYHETAPELTIPMINSLVDRYYQ